MFLADLGCRPWSRTAAPAFICLVPYDRHFALNEECGFRMLPVAVTDQGPDRDAVEALAADRVCLFSPPRERETEGNLRAGNFETR